MSRTERTAAAVALLAYAVILARLVVTAVAGIDHVEAAAAARHRVLVPAYFDVSVRDAPKARELLRGRLFSDPHYTGEVHWYPFVSPLLAAGATRLSGGTVARGYLLTEVAAVVAFLVVALLAYLRLFGWARLWILPLSVWLEWFAPGNGLLPWESARAPLCLFFLVAATIIDQERREARRPLPIWALGALLGLLSIWTGASFFACVPAAAAIGAWSLARARRRGELRAALKAWAGAGAASLALFALLAAPQLLRYGALRPAGSARLYLSPWYGAGVSFARALTLHRHPEGAAAALVALCFLGLLPWRAEPWLRRTRDFAWPLALTYALCMGLGALGFGLYDPHHPTLSAFVRRVIPAPPPTFYIVALSSLGFLVGAVGARMALGALEGLAARVARHRGHDPAALADRGRAIGTALSAAAFVALVPTFPPRPAPAAGEIDRDLAAFAERAERAAGGATVFVRDALTLVQASGMRVLWVDLPDHTNHYVKAERARAVQEVDRALARGDFRQADRVLTAFAVAFVIERPGQATDPVVRYCAGAARVEGAGFRLRHRRPCGLGPDASPNDRSGASER